MATTMRPTTETRLIQWRQWWQLRSPAEHTVWLVVGGIALVLLAWVLIWQPLTRDTERLERRLIEQRTTLATARRQADEIAALARSTADPSPRDARSDVESALARQGLKATAIDRGDDQRLRVTLDAVSFAALTSLLEALQRDARLNAVDLTATARVEPGQVRAEMTFSSAR
ncbi:MAG TPA: type II secretion system protein M [Casimicrobiaceae bacterium]|nr:type II secretion system protein M [Casimicrobiaceae bacterium]